MCSTASRIDATIMEPRPYRYFQSALVDPSTKIPLLKEPPPQCATPSPSPPLLAGKLTITISTSSSNTRTWNLPRSLLAKHSTFFAEKCSDESTTSIHLISMEPHAFTNFATYMHSNIYSLNEHITDFRAIRHNTLAVLLGHRLGCQDYVHAAMRQLYLIFEPLARLRTSNARKSSIRASDVAFVCKAVCEAADDADNSALLGLRQLFFDAVCAHWTAYEAGNIEAVRDTLGDTVDWTSVHIEYPEFRAALHHSGTLKSRWRCVIFRSVNDYIDKQRCQTVVSDDRGKLFAMLAESERTRMAEKNKSRHEGVKKRIAGGKRDRDGGFKKRWVERWADGVKGISAEVASPCVSVVDEAKGGEKAKDDSSDSFEW